MKANSLLSALPALLFPTLLLAQSGAYTIQGQVGRQVLAGKAYLMRPLNGSLHTDSAEVQRGRFTFKGTVDEPTRAWLVLERPGRSYRTPAPSLKLFVEPGTVRVLSADSLPHATLGGTPANIDQQKLMQLTQASRNRLAALEQEMQAASPAKQQDKAYAASHAKRYQAANDELNQLNTQFINSTPNSLVSLYLVLEYADSPLDPAKSGPLFESLSPTIRQSAKGQRFAARLATARRLAVGEPAPSFTQTDPSGKLVKLSDFHGKYVLVDFWASWCGPCRAENPNVIAAYNKFKAQNFTIIGVSLDDATTREAWLQAIQADGLPWTQVSDLKGWKNEAAQLYDINSIPQNLLVGPDGRIVAKNLRGEELGRQLAAVLPGSAQ